MIHEGTLHNQTILPHACGCMFEMHSSKLAVFAEGNMCAETSVCAQPKKGIRLEVQLSGVAQAEHV
jgi:hypothetical protein